jgi:hypothetical protein
VLQTFGILLVVMAYISYGINGYGMPGWKLLGRIMESASEISFLLLLVLLAKGYIVSRQVQEAKTISEVDVY